MIRSPVRVLVVGYGPVGARFAENLLPAVRAGEIALTVVGAERERCVQPRPRRRVRRRLDGT